MRRVRGWTAFLVAHALPGEPLLRVKALGLLSDRLAGGASRCPRDAPPWLNNFRPPLALAGLQSGKRSHEHRQLWFTDWAETWDGGRPLRPGPQESFQLLWSNWAAC